MGPSAISEFAHRCRGRAGLPTRTSQSKRKNFCIGITDPVLEMRLAEKLAPIGRVTLLREIVRQGAEPTFREKFDVLVVSPCILRGALHGGWPTLTRFFDEAFIMVINGDDDIQIHRDLFDLADGWVIGEKQIDNFSKVIELSMAGYQTLPSSETNVPIHVPAAADKIWSLSKNEFAIMTEFGRDQPVDQRRKWHDRNVPIISITRSGLYKKYRSFNHINLLNFSLFVKGITENGLRRLIKFNNDTEFSVLLSWIIRVEFVVLLGIALYSGEGSIARILQSVVSHE